jgi:hypothetical protein
MGMELVEFIEVGAGGAASIEFTGIPQDGVDLVLVYSTRLDVAAAIHPVTFALNSNTSNLSSRRLYGSGSGANSNTFVGGGQTSAATSTSNTFGNQSLYISNYTSSANKSISIDSVSENNATAAYQEIYGLAWADTTAVSSITLSVYGGSGNFVQYSTASLYKITAD